jgi:hypothetical protein
MALLDEIVPTGYTPNGKTKFKYASKYASTYTKVSVIVPTTEPIVEPVVTPNTKHVNKNVIAYEKIQQITIAQWIKDNATHMLGNCNINTRINDVLNNSDKIIRIMAIPLNKFYVSVKSPFLKVSLEITAYPHLIELFQGMTNELAALPNITGRTFRCLSTSNSRTFINLNMSTYCVDGERVTIAGDNEDVGFKKLKAMQISKTKYAMNIYLKTIKLSGRHADTYMTPNIYKMFIYEYVAPIKSPMRVRRPNLYTLDEIKREHIFRLDEMNLKKAERIKSLII